LIAANDIDEDAAEAAIYDARKAELAASLDARLPPEVSAAVLSGDSLLKTLRKWKDVTQMHLSFSTGVAQGRIGDLEAGRRKGAKETLAAITKALEIDEVWLNDAPKENRPDRP
jgi:predicted transcriptional regulator